MADDARDRFLGKASKRGVGALKGYGQASPLSEVVSGFVGAPRQFSVMDPDAREMQQARDLGEQASVAAQLYGALTPFAAGKAAGVLSGLGALGVVKLVKLPTGETHSVIVPGRLSNLKEAIRQKKGEYGARRVERAADEIPNLERLYEEEALREAFRGDNAKALMTLNPKDFEKYSAPLNPQPSLNIYYTSSGEQMDYPQYMTEYLPNVGPFSDVPFLTINKQRQGSSKAPFISGHEGRHRSRVLADKGEQASLVQLLPDAELREPFPRRYQDEYLEALKKELGLSNYMVNPETYFDKLMQKEIKRKAIGLPDVYAAGGAVHMQDGGKMDMSKVHPLQQERASFIPTASQLREAFERGPLAVARSAKRTFLSGGLPADILRAYGEASVPLNQAITAALGAPIENLRSPPKVDELSEAGTFIPIGDRYRETFGEILGDPLNFIPSAGTVKALGQAGKALGAAGLRKLDEAMLEGTGPLALAVRPVAPVAAASRFPKSSPPTVRPKINEIAPPTRAEMLNELAQKGEPAAVSELARILGPEEIKVQPEMPVASPVVASAQAIEQVDQPIVMAGGPSIRPEQLDQPVADVIRRGQPIEPMTQPPTLDEVAAARSDSRTSAAIVAERLPIIVPEAERVLGGVYTPGRPDGGKWSDLTTEQLNKRGPGFKFTDNDLEKLWNESLSEVSEAAKQAVQKTGATWRGFTAEDFNIAFSLPLRHQLWYELSGEAFVDRLPDLNLRESLILLDLVGATSAKAKPGENLERSLAILSQRMRGVPIDVDITIPSTVAQALRRDGSNISSDLANKTGMFADTIALTGGIPVRFPISVNDVWEARTYGITDEALSANQPLHEMFAKYQNKVRDLVNQSGTFEFPLQSWNVQSRKWVKQRFDDEGIDVFGPESLKGSDYSVEFDKIVKKLENAGINVPDGKITREVLMDPRTADALRPATPRFRDAPKATVEVGTILTPSGKEGYEIYQAAKTIGDVLTQDEYRGVLTSILYDSARGKPTPWEALVRVATDRAQPVTRIYSPTRDDPFSISGTFEGAAGPNIRVPLADMTPDQISYFNAVAGLGLKQKAMAAAEIKRVDPNSVFPQDAIPTSSVRFDYFSKVPETMLTDFTNALGKGFEISVMKYPDGLVFDINPRFTDAGPEGPTAQEIDQAVAVLQRKYNVQNLEVFPTAYRSEYGKNYVEDDGTGATYRAIIDDTLKGWNNGYAEAIQQVAGSRATRQDIEAFLEGRIDKLPLQVSEAGATSAEKSSILGKANTIRKAARQRASDHAAAVKAFEDIGLAVDRKMAEAIPRWKKRAERIAAQEAKKKPPQTPGMARGGAVRISQYRPYLLHHKFDEEFAAGGAVKPKTSEFEGMNFYDILFSR